MNEPMDAKSDPFTSVAAEIVVTCGSRDMGDVPHVDTPNGDRRRVRSFTFRRMKSRDGRIGGWEAVRELDEGDRRAQGGILPTPKGWWIECPTCRQKQRFNRDRLGAMLDTLAAMGFEKFPLSELAKYCAR